MMKIEEGFMAFLADGGEGVAAVRRVRADGIVLYVENSGEFVVPISAVSDVHSQKVILNARMLDAKLLEAIKRVHASEDPRLTG